MKRIISLLDKEIESEKSKKELIKWAKKEIKEYEKFIKLLGKK